MYTSSPTSPDHWITFLHLALSWSIESSQSRMFSNLIFHLTNLEWRALSMAQSILGPSTIGYHQSRVVELWIRNMIDFITRRCCCCTFLSVGFVSFRSWIFHGFLGGSSCVSHSIISVCLETVSVISVVLFSALESRLAQLCTHTCHLDCCHEGWVSLEALWQQGGRWIPCWVGFQVWATVCVGCMGWWNLTLGKLSYTPELVQ